MFKKCLLFMFISVTLQGKNINNNDLALRDYGMVTNENTKAKIIGFGGYNTPECKLAIDLYNNDLYRINDSRCKLLKNSKGITIVCNSNKSICKTKSELIKYVKTSTYENIQKPKWCKNATTNIEKQICNNNVLLNLEKKLNELYHTALNNKETNNRKQIINSQRKWIKNRNKKCSKLGVKCIEKFYKFRISNLRKQLLPKDNNIIEFKNINENRIYKKHYSANKLKGIYPIINKKHLKDINIAFIYKNKYITYSDSDKTIKIWDKKTRKLLKTFHNIFNVKKVLQDKKYVLFWSIIDTRANIGNLYLLDLEKIRLKKLLSNKRPISDVKIISDSIVESAINSNDGAIYNNLLMFTFFLEKEKSKTNVIYECPFTRCFYDVFKNDINHQTFYIKVNEVCKKINYKEHGKIENSDKCDSIILDGFPYTGKIVNKKLISTNDFIEQKTSTNIKFKVNNHPKDTPMIYAINKVENTCLVYKSKKIHCAVAQGGSGAYDSEFINSIYTTNNQIMITEGFIGTSVGESSRYIEKSGYYIYIIDKNGKLVKRIPKKYEQLDKKINQDTLRIYNDENYIVWSNMIEVLDENFKTIKILKNTLSDNVIFIKRKNNKIIVYYKNNIEQVFDKKGNELFKKYTFNKNIYLKITPEGFFTGKGNFAEYIHFIDSNYKIYLINQFYDHFFRPDLVKLKLNDKEDEYQKAIKGLNYKEALKNPPPIVSFVSVDDNKVKKDGFDYKSVKVSKNRVKLTFNIKQKDNGGIGIIRVYQEGKLIKTIGSGKIKHQSANLDSKIEQEMLDKKAKEKQKEYLALSKAVDKNLRLDTNDTIAKYSLDTTNNKEGAYSVDIELKSGSNQISIEAFNKTNTVTSFRENLNINANIPKQEPNLYVVSCGVNDFESKNVNNLQYSQNDANAIANIAKNRFKTEFKNVEVTKLFGKEFTKNNLLNVLDKIKQKAKITDTVLVYISTHGRAVNGKLFLAPYNNANAKNWINFKEMFDKAQEIKTLNQIFIVDACESGEANDIVSSVYDSRASVLARSAGVHLFLATTKGTYAFESQDKNIKNSVFTYKILKALNNKKSDLNKDGIITVKELAKALKNYSNDEYQYPIIRSVGSDIKLEKVN